MDVGVWWAQMHWCLDADGVRLAAFLFYLSTLVQRAKPHLQEMENRSIPYPHWSILSIDNSIAFEQMMTNCINHQIIFTRTEDNLKNIIKDKMKLRTNITSPQISDICHQRWVIIRENKELTHLSTSIPFWNFLTILKFGVHHESWKSPDLSSEKISISLGGQLNWSESCCFARCQIVQVGCMLDSKWP